METKHTKGPWEWQIEDHSLATLKGPHEMEDEVMSVSPCGSCIKNNKEQKFKWGSCKVPNEHDAKLIAASPVLLEALQELLVLAESGYQANVKNKHSEEFLKEDRTLLMKAREAIKLATEYP
jgi:hypothetical protein